MGIRGKGGDKKGGQDWKMTRMQRADDGGYILYLFFLFCDVQLRAPDLRIREIKQPGQEGHAVQ